MQLVVQKTWQYDVNHTVVGASMAAISAEVLLGIKQAMCGFASNPWTVVASSNAVVANGSDNWNTVADIVWALSPGAHSWIVLEQAAMNGGAFQVLLTCDNGTAYRLGVFISPDGSYGAPWQTTVDPSATYSI